MLVLHFCPLKTSHFVVLAVSQSRETQSYIQGERDGRTWWGDDLAQTYSPGFGVDDLLHVPSEALELLFGGPEHWACSLSHAACCSRVEFGFLLPFPSAAWR